MGLGNSPVITIGAAAALSGGAGQLGWQQVNAVRLAVDQTNAAGGINIGGTAYSVTLAIADSGCNEAIGVSAANELIAAGAVAVIGPTCSIASFSAAPIFNAAGVAMVSPSSTSPRLTQLGHSTTFRTTPHDGSAVIRLAEFFAGTGRTRTAILLRSDWLPWSRFVEDFYASTYTALGGSITSSRVITTTADITPTLTAIQAESVDVVMVGDFHGFEGDVVGKVSRIAHRLEMPATIASLGASDDYITTLAGPQAAEGDYGGIVGRRTSNMPGYAAFEAAYLAAGFSYEPSPGPYSPASFDATSIVMDAIERANSTDILAIRGQIAATANYAGVVGTYVGFDGNGDAIPQWARVEVVENGEWVPARLVGEIYPHQGGRFDLANALGRTTVIDIPAGTTTETLIITYTLVADVNTTDIPNKTMMGKHAIRLESNVAVSSAMTLTINYDDNDVTGLDESTLALYVWKDGRWVDADPCGGYGRDPINNKLETVICHFSDYALFADLEYTTRLPIVLK